jgi:hypothetical protein
MKAQPVDLLEGQRVKDDLLTSCEMMVETSFKLRGRGKEELVEIAQGLREIVSRIPDTGQLAYNLLAQIEVHPLTMRLLNSKEPPELHKLIVDDDFIHIECGDQRYKLRIVLLEAEIKS